MIEVKNLHKTYASGDTSVHALRGIDVSVEQGAFLAFAGPSGSGKSTLLNILGCLDTPNSGSFTIAGQDMIGLDAKGRAAYRRTNLGFVFQSFNLIPVLTARENVALSLQLLNLPRDEVNERANAILAEVGLAGMEDRRPGRLSGGQQQRVAVARALVKEPAVILADEPTANLDSETGAKLIDTLLALNASHGTTCIFSTHDPMVMERSQRVVRLRDGLITPAVPSTTPGAPQ